MAVLLHLLSSSGSGTTNLGNSDMTICIFLFILFSTNIFVGTVLFIAQFPVNLAGTMPTLGSKGESTAVSLTILPKNH